jgi:hypothetical protein
MAQDPDNSTDATPVTEQVERQTIREVLEAQHQARVLEQQEAERARRIKRREDRVKQHRAERETRARQAHARRLKALNEVNEQVGAHVGSASRSLRAALRAVSEVSAPRHTEEGREQQRLVRALQTAMGALRGVGRGDFHETDIDLGAELDAL